MTIWEHIADIPWWIYALFIYLVQVAILAIKPHTIPIRDLFILPLLLIFISLFVMYNFGFQLQFFTLWIAGTALGSAMGWLQFYILKIKTITNENKIYIPGTWSLFLLPFAFCCMEYYSILYSIDLLNTQFLPWLFAFYGVCFGFSLGRLFYTRKCVKNAS